MVAALGSEGIDVLIHNAGVYHEGRDAAEVMEINAVAPVRVTEALLPAVLRSAQKKIIWITSQLGARRGASGSLGVYGDSKAAMNDALRERAPGWSALGLTAIVLHPGWVRTDMGGANAPVTVEESAAGIFRVASELDAKQHGAFLTWRGEPHPW